jgi:hypothetical protein
MTNYKGPKNQMMVFQKAMLLLIWLFLIPSFILGIIGTVKSSENGSSSSSTIKPDETVLFNSQLDPFIVPELNNTNITMTLSIFGDKIWIVVDTWIGYCESHGSPHYAPSFTTLTAIPDTYRPINSTSGEFIASPFQLYPSSSNGTLGTGQAQIEEDGIMVFYYNINDISKSWERDCIIYSFVMTYLKRIK